MIMEKFGKVEKGLHYAGDHCLPVIDENSAVYPGQRE